MDSIFLNGINIPINELAEGYLEIALIKQYLNLAIIYSNKTVESSPLCLMFTCLNIIIKLLINTMKQFF